MGITNGDAEIEQAWRASEEQRASAQSRESHRMYAVKDSKAEAFLTPIFATTDGVALRMLEAAVNDPNHDFHRFADDYALWRIGSFCEGDGIVEGCQPEMLIHCSQLRKEQ